MCAGRDAIDAGWVGGPRIQCAGAFNIAPSGGDDIVDLVALDEDPLADVTVLERPVVVMNGGRAALDLRAG